MAEVVLPRRVPHIFLRQAGSRELYTNPSVSRVEPSWPSRKRSVHGAKLQAALGVLAARAQTIAAGRQASGLSSEFGMLIEFESSPGFLLPAEKLERRKSGIELLNVRRRAPALIEGGAQPSGEVTVATVLVPFGRLTDLTQLVTDYLHVDTAKLSKPKNQELIESIDQIREAALGALWTEEDVPFPDPEEKRWWEVWLRVGPRADERDKIVERFRLEAAQAGIQCNRECLRLPENSVLLALGTGAQFGKSLDLLNCLTELRLPSLTADFFQGRLNTSEQADLINEAVAKATWPDPAAGAVCLLDTGVNNGHPLLAPALATSDCATYDVNWGVHDHHGHGTLMAGLALFGDLVNVLGSAQSVVLKHRLESVKILPPNPNQPNNPKLYGEITKECVARAETAAPTRTRTFCMAIASEDGRCRGRPTSWSSAVDQICSGASEEDTPRRLVVLSAGNSLPTHGHQYPAMNLTDQVHDPAQAWNALTIGTVTEKSVIDAQEFPGWQPLAPKGGLGPSGTTSLIWAHEWPFKPDLVLEGGNMARSPHDDSLDHLPSLQLLTTHREVQAKLLALTGDTSAAAAQAARMAAMIQAEYPSLWPETVRGLMVQSANWTAEMGRSCPEEKPKWWIKDLLRTYGFGVPNLGRALHSAANSLTLICQDELQPFAVKEGQVKTNDLVLYDLPWPRAELEALGELDVTMRVTLSYFIEPNPGPRLTSDRYRYASCGLRFVVCHPAESAQDFRWRINREARTAEDPLGGVGHDTDGWILGSDLRHRGSLHSDIWRGTAAELALKNKIAIYPVKGWWCLRRHLRRYNAKVRYALIVTIKTKRQDIDIYTPVLTQVSISTQIQSGVQV